MPYRIYTPDRPNPYEESIFEEKGEAFETAKNFSKERTVECVVIELRKVGYGRGVAIFKPDGNEIILD